MTRANASIGTVHYAVSIDASGHHMVADEPPENGGANSGPAPYDLLLASLGACTAITLAMYADRKQWALKALLVELHYTKTGETQHIARTLRMDGALSDEQRARLADIAERTPVTLTLKGGVAISTEVVPPPAPSRHAADVSARLDEALDESFPASDSPDVSP